MIEKNNIKHHGITIQSIETLRVNHILTFIGYQYKMVFVSKSNLMHIQKE